MARKQELLRAFCFPTELGWFALTWRGERLSRLTIGHPSAPAAAAALENEADELVCEDDSPGWVRDLVERLQAYACGEPTDFADVSLDLGHLTDFQAKVVRACRRIGHGRVKTYGQLAQAVGVAGAARAVGSVMAKNRFPIIVPCHRVVGTGNSLGGFSAPGGISFKQRMLDLESQKTSFKLQTV